MIYVKIYIMKMLLNQRIEEWLDDTTQILNISSLGLTEWPKQLIGKEYLIKKLDCSNNQLISLPNNLTKLEKLYCSVNELTDIPNNLTNLKSLYCCYNKLVLLPNNLTKLKKLYCSNNELFSDELEKWKKIWPISIRHQRTLRNSGLKRVIKILKCRLYLPRLDELLEELIWSPDHPGKFFILLPRVGNWCSKH